MGAGWEVHVYVAKKVSVKSRKEHQLQCASVSEAKYPGIVIEE